MTKRFIAIIVFLLGVAHTPFVEVHAVPVIAPIAGFVSALALQAFFFVCALFFFALSIVRKYPLWSIAVAISCLFIGLVLFLWL